MRVVIDIEADALENPTEIWLIVCKDIDTGNQFIFRHPTKKDYVSEFVRKDFLRFAEGVGLWIGHNCLGYDFPVLARLLDFDIDAIWTRCIDTLVVSKLLDYSREGHSIEDYGNLFELPKGKFVDFSKYSPEMEEYCIRDVEICEKIYRRYYRSINSDWCRDPLLHEQWFQYSVVNSLHDNGFAFNVPQAEKYLAWVQNELIKLDKDIEDAFPPKLKLIRKITPKETKHGTLHRGDFRWVVGGDLSEFNGGPFCRCTWSDFNPSSHKQIIGVLHDAGWKPVAKTKTHQDTERRANRLKYTHNRDKELDIELSLCHTRLQELSKTGWKINDENLQTLPANAPQPARTLAQRILLEARRRTLVEWLDLVQADGRIHGTFYGIGAWTHRMAHQKPNTANIPNEFNLDKSKKLLGKELRSLWVAPKKRLLIGVDAEGIQLRIFAHYIDDKEFTEALINGDPHTLNQSILGDACKSRAAAKRFIYALLLGAGLGKLSEILETGQGQTKEALDRLLERYQGFDYLKRTVIPSDAQRGWFIGLDGRRVVIPGDTVGERKHLCMSGYLQNGEAVIMKRATLKWVDKLKEYDAKLVNFVHDEWQIECSSNMSIALEIASMVAGSLPQVGEELNLKCPLAGSYWNKDHNDYTIHTNWSLTH